jgi:hypothetical protein
VSYHAVDLATVLAEVFSHAAAVEIGYRLG